MNRLSDDDNPNIRHERWEHVLHRRMEYSKISEMYILYLFNQLFFILCTHACFLRPIKK